MTDKRKAKPTKDSQLRLNLLEAHKAIPAMQEVFHWVVTQTGGGLGNRLRDKCEIVMKALEKIRDTPISEGQPENPTKGGL